ncbi:hypothetical protein [Actinoallomurus sp. NPDC052274]|uniref:hypothetical protein n=1 Tax=Actinoallomurus sp. NPDC052274 TaxID=3155420 RepID=UPI003434F569
MTQRHQAETPPGKILDGLESLERELKISGFTTQIIKHRARPPTLHVRNPKLPHMDDEISCTPYAKENGDLWFFFSWGHPISHVAHIALAVLYVKHVLRSVR